MSAEIRSLNPPTVWTVPEEFRAVYTHATEVRGPARTLYISGQFGVRPDGSLPGGFADQARQALANIEALLTAASMSMKDVVKLTCYLIHPDNAAGLVSIRREAFAGQEPPAVTVLTVSALARPDYLIEIEAIAAA